MIVLYKNDDKETITQEQAALSSSYSKIYILDNGMVKKEEKFMDNELYNVDYYLHDNESREEAKALLASSYPAFHLVEKQAYSNGYVMYHHDCFRENNLTGKFKLLQDAGGTSICYSEIDIETNQPIYEETNKYLGKYIDDDTPNYCTFHYRSDGTLYYCEYNYYHEYDSEEFNLETVSEIKDRFRLSDAMYNYYLTAKIEPIGLT
jgi:hypothetical protein